MKENRGVVTFAGLVFGAAIVVWAHVSMGGSLQTFAQVEALAVVFGGTTAALMVSFPTRALRSAWAGIRDLFDSPPVALESMVPTFIGFARKAKRQGLAALEQDVDGHNDKFLVRAVSVSLTGYRSSAFAATFPTCSTPAMSSFCPPCSKACRSSSWRRWRERSRSSVRPAYI